MVEIKTYLSIFEKQLQELFQEKLFFFGIQGSYARGEATENSDIDVVVILENLTPSLLLEYKKMVDSLPFRDKLCGFVSGKEELFHWNTSELFQFYYDTVPIFGTLDDLLPLITKDVIKQAVHAGACSIYHSCCHNILHETNAEILKSHYKSSVFLLQAKSFLETGCYSKTKKELYQRISKEESFIIDISQKPYEITKQRLEEFSFLLLQWTSRIITKKSLL